MLAGFFAQEGAYLVYLASLTGNDCGSPHQGCGPMGNGNAYLYYEGVNAPYAAHYPFYDITSGCNSNDITVANKLTAFCSGAGYDSVTGWGTANMLQLAWTINTFIAGDFAAPAVNLSGPLINHYFNTPKTVSWTIGDVSGNGAVPTGVAGFSQAWDADPGDSYSKATPGNGDSFYSGPQYPLAVSGSMVLDSSNEGCHTVHVRAWDNAGESGDNTYGPVCFDDIAPTISFGGTCPATADMGVTTFITVSVSDSLSGVASQSRPNGPNLLDTSSQGFKTFTVSAQDNAGNSATKDCTYKVVRKLTAAGPFRAWLGLKNSDDVGTRFDLKAELFVNGTKVGEGQIGSVWGGSSGFNNALLSQIPLILNGTPEVPVNAALTITLSSRDTCAGKTHNSGTQRLWYNDAQASSGFDATLANANTGFFLRSGFVLNTAAGPGPKNTIDEFVDNKTACPARPFTAFGTWSITLP